VLRDINNTGAIRYFLEAFASTLFCDWILFKSARHDLEIKMLPKSKYFKMSHSCFAIIWWYKRCWYSGWSRS